MSIRMDFALTSSSRPVEGFVSTTMSRKDRRIRARPLMPLAFVLAGLALGGFTSANAAEAGSDRAEPSSAQRESATETVKLKEVVVTGSRLPSAESQAAQDVHIYRIERIEQSGQSTLADFLGSLPEVSL